MIVCISNTRTATTMYNIYMDSDLAFSRTKDAFWMMRHSRLCPVTCHNWRAKPRTTLIASRIPKPPSPLPTIFLINTTRNITTEAFNPRDCHFDKGCNIAFKRKSSLEEYGGYRCGNCHVHKKKKKEIQMSSAK